MKRIFLIFVLFMFAGCFDGNMIEKGLESTLDPRLPEIRVKQGDEYISPETGIYIIRNVNVNETSPEIQFTIENAGTSELILYGSPAVEDDITADPGNELIITQPLTNEILPGTNVTFNVLFTPADTSAKEIPVSIMSNDSYFPVFEFVIGALGNPIPDFSARVRKGFTPLTVDFENRTDYGPFPGTAVYMWDFNGDGDYSDAVTAHGDDPTHVYNTPGIYSVALRVIRPGVKALDSILVYEFKSAYIEVMDYNRITIDGGFEDALQVTTGDLNGDGFLDVIACAGPTPGLSWWRNNGNGTFTHNQIDGTLIVYGITAVDLNGDTFTDLLLAASDGIHILWNDGSANFTLYTVDISFDKARAVCAADFNGDMLIDIAAVSAAMTPALVDIAWWHNDGIDGLFDNGIDPNIHEIAFQFDGNLEAMDITAVDIDQDIDEDIIVSSYNKRTVAWWENDGAGTFASGDEEFPAGCKHTVVSDVKAWAIHTADFNDDGNIDILGAAFNLSELTNTTDIAIFKNTGGGTFPEVDIVPLAVNFQLATSISTGDLDGDGDIDITASAANDPGIRGDTSSVTMWLNNGEFNFTKKVIDGAFKDAVSVHVADITGDLFPDVIAASNEYHEIAYWSLLNTFNTITWDNEAIEPSGVIASDLNGDGSNDIIVMSQRQDEIYWWENTLTQNYVKHGVINNTTLFKKPSAVGSADFDNDGDNDIVAASDAPGTHIYLGWWENADRTPGAGDGDGTSWTGHPLVEAADIDGKSIAIIDLNEDGFVDIVSGTTNAVSWWENDGTGSFTEHEIDSPVNAVSVFARDIGDDDDTDIIAVDGTTGETAWYENDGTNIFVEQPAIDTVTNPTVVRAAHLNDDDYIDIVCGSDGDLSWYESETQPTPTFTTKHQIGTPDGVSGIFIRDINNDTDKDIITSHSDENLICIWRNQGDDTFLKYPVKYNFYGASSVFSTDIDNDGDPDIIGTAENDDRVEIWYNNIVY